MSIWPTFQSVRREIRPLPILDHKALRGRSTLIPAVMPPIAELCRSDLTNGRIGPSESAIGHDSQKSAQSWAGSPGQPSARLQYDMSTQGRRQLSAHFKG